MNTMIVGGAIYLIVGGIIMAVAEEKEWIDISSIGYILFPVLWLPICLAIIPYVLVRLLIIWWRTK